MQFSEEQHSWLERGASSANQARRSSSCTGALAVRHHQLVGIAVTVLSQHEVDAVIAGHFHSLQKDETRDGVEYHILGMPAGMIQTSTR